MSLVFAENWASYANGTAIPAYPSKLGGLWFKTGIFGGFVIDTEHLLGFKALQFDVQGGIGWENAVDNYASGTFITYFKGGEDTGGYFNSLELYDAAIPPTGPFPSPVLLARFHFEADGTLSLRGPDGVIIANSGKILNDTGPLGVETTIPWSLDPTRWYIIQFNFECSVDIHGKVIISACVHVDSQPILVVTATSTTNATAFPNGTSLSISFNRLNLFTPKNNVSYNGFFSFDTSSSIQPGSTDPLKQSNLRATQAVIEPLILPAARDAHVSQAVIELPTLPDRFARVTQAVIELMTTGIIRRVKRWRIYEA